MNVHRVLRVTEVGEYIRYHSCQRRFKLKFNNYQSAKNIPFFELIFQTSLDPVLEESGRSSEQKWAESLILTNRKCPSPTWIFIL